MFQRLLTLPRPLGSSMFAPGIPKIMAEFHESSSIVATFMLSIYILGFAFGPILVAPMSEIYGRSLLYHIGNVAFVIFSVGAALSNSIGMLMAFRFLMGLVGSVPITIGSGSIADVMPVEMRGRAMAAWALGPLLGPCIGPVAGGYLIAAAGWRWIYWLIVIVVSTPQPPNPNPPDTTTNTPNRAASSPSSPSSPSARPTPPSSSSAKPPSFAKKPATPPSAANTPASPPPRPPTNSSSPPSAP